jgi:hypothetical protein
MQAALHGRQADAHRGGHLFPRKPFEITHLQHLSFQVGQCGDCLDQDFSFFHSLRKPFRRCIRSSKARSRTKLFERNRIVRHHPVMAIQTMQRVASNREQERPRAVLDPGIGGGTPGRDKRLLQHILCIRVVRRETPDEPIDGTSMPGHEHTKRHGITMCGGGQKLVIR